MEVRETKIASVDDVIEILEADKSELTYEQQLALQHAKRFNIPEQRLKKLRKSLDELGILSDRTVIKLLEIMPKNQMTVRQILASERKTFSDEEVNGILALTKEKG
jgi:DNA-directed RNA polymerase subunit F